MSKIKLYLIIFAVLFLAGAVVTVNLQAKKIKAQKAEIERLDGNISYLTTKGKITDTFLATEKEFKQMYKDSLKTVLLALKIKPKTVTKVVTNYIYVHDTINKEVFVSVIGKNRWLVSDTGKCFTWSGIATLKNDSLNVVRTEYVSENKITDVFHGVRKKILGLRIGRKEITQTRVNECGESFERIIEVIK